MRLALPALPAVFARSSLRMPRWGVHPEDHKRPAADAPVRRLPLPRRLYLPLQQHVGQPARPIVWVGQTVQRGELIAEANGRIGAPVHASASGRVVAIGEITAPHPSGLPFMAITLETARDEPPSADAPMTAEATDPFALAPAEATARIAAAGVVGLGGATFPSSVKLALGRKTGIYTLIVNGGECEPYLSCDDRLMRDHAAGVVDGVRLMLHCTGARRALVGIETNKPEAIAAMRRAAAAFPPIRVVPVPSRYPMGSDRQLIETLTGKEVPSDCRAADVGVIVHNVHTAYAAHRAVRIGEPLIERLVTINGGAVWQPGNVLVPIGTLAADLLDFVGLKSEPARLVMGGPMMGSVLPHANVPVVKGCAGLLALSEAETSAGLAAEPCIRCGSCVQACPIGLLPLEMGANVRAGELRAAADLGLSDCIACGCCAYVCPSHIPLAQYFAHAKGELWAQERATLRMEATRKLAASRTARLEREAREKAEAAARRKAERAAAKRAEEAAATTVSAITNASASASACAAAIAAVAEESA